MFHAFIAVHITHFTSNVHEWKLDAQPVENWSWETVF